MENTLKNYALYLKIDKDLSDATLRSYTKDVEMFLSYGGTPKDFTRIEDTHIRDYIRHMQETGKSRGTVQRNMSSIRSFFEYLRTIEKIIVESPVKDMSVPNRGKPLPKAISESDTLRLIEVSMEEGIKTRLLLELLYGSGGRVSEIISLKIDDIHFDENYIKIVGKGNKERHNPIHKGCIDLIKEYMKSYNISEGYLFPHRSDKNKHMSRITAYKIVKRIADTAGVDPKSVSPYVFRHSFATHMLDNGCDMSLVQEYLGHEDIATTKIYARVTKSNKTNTYKKFHPLAR